MAESPFVGPTYPLASRPASVQRTVNMTPVPLEPGNERTRWVFKDVPGLVSVATTIHTCFGGPIWSVTTVPNSRTACIIYAAGKFVVGTNPVSGGNGKILYSTNGYEWTQVNTPVSDTYGVSSIAYGNGRFVAVPASTDQTIESVDGVTWTLGASNPNVLKSQRFGIWFGQGVFVICAGSVAQIFVSSSASNQTSISTPYAFNTGLWNPGNNLHYACRKSSNQIYTSPDLMTWTLKSSTSYSGGSVSTKKLVSNGGANFIALDGDNQQNFLSFSSDFGATWGNGVGLPVGPSYYRDLIYVQAMDMWLVTNADGVIYESLNNGANWNVTVGTLNPILGDTKDWYMAATPSAFLYAAICDRATAGTVAAVGVC